MAKYDGLIIPHSYSDYLNKTDGATLSQMLDSIGGTFDASPTPNSVKPARSGGIFAANAVITSNNATLTGVTISERSVVRVMFTAALTGSDATTGLTLTYNGTAYAVKVGKDGALEALTAHLIEESYIYLQAYTTLELAFDGSQFVVMGNPVVISNADFSIMADGFIAQKNISKVNLYANIGTAQAFGMYYAYVDLSAIQNKKIISFEIENTQSNAPCFIQYAASTDKQRVIVFCQSPNTTIEISVSYS